MSTSLLWRPWRPVRAVPVYLLLSGGAAASFSLIATLNLVYQATVVGLSPLQLVLVGTLLETVCFVFEVPTGIVADLYGRRLSVIVGFALMGAGFALEGAIPTFTAVLGAQVIWGIGATFTSGAVEAWITDEVGEEAIAPVFLRGTQLGLAGTITGIAGAATLGLIDIRVPIVTGGLLFIALAVTLLLIMPETAFHRTPPDERSTFAHMRETASTGLALARRRPVVGSLLLASLVIGLSSEAFDRLWVVHMLDEFDLPSLRGSDSPVLFFSVFSLAGTVIALAVSEAVNRLRPDLIAALHPRRLMTILAAAQVLTVLAFALAGNLWIAVALLWSRAAFGTLARPVSAAWMNRNLDPATRATVLSMEGQANAIGQIVGGPALGAVGSAVSVRAALVLSALVLSPIVALYWRMRTSTTTR